MVRELGGGEGFCVTAPAFLLPLCPGVGQSVPGRGRSLRLSGQCVMTRKTVLVPAGHRWGCSHGRTGTQGRKLEVQPGVVYWAPGRGRSSLHFALPRGQACRLPEPPLLYPSRDCPGGPGEGGAACDGSVHTSRPEAGVPLLPPEAGVGAVLAAAVCPHPAVGQARQGPSGLCSVLGPASTCGLSSAAQVGPGICLLRPGWNRRAVASRVCVCWVEQQGQLRLGSALVSAAGAGS